MDRRKRERERERKRTARRLLQKCQDPDEQEGVQFSFEMPGDQNKAYNDFHGNQQNSPALTPSVFMYHTPKGIVYSTGSLPDKFNFQQVTSQDSADSVPAINSDQLTNQTNEHVQQDESNICTNGYEEKRRRIRRKDTKAYIRYLNDRRDSFRRENPSISNPNYQIHMMSIEWRNMPDEEKEKYRDAAEKDMERFNEEMLEYQKTGDCKEFHAFKKFKPKPPVEAFNRYTKDRRDEFNKQRASMTNPEFHQGLLSTVSNSSTGSRNEIKVEPIESSLASPISTSTSTINTDSTPKKHNQRSKRKGKDPIPMTPMVSAFFRFMFENGGPFCESYEDLKWDSQTTKMSLLWNSLPEHEKQKYLEAAQEDKIKQEALSLNDSSTTINSDTTQKVDSCSPEPPILYRPLKPYTRYSMEVRDKLKIIHPDLSVYKMGELIGSMWQGLSEAEKQVYRDDYQREKDQNLDRLGDENPNAQIPMFSAFLRFMKENRGPYCGWNEDITWNPQTCKMSLKWHLLPEQEKKRYLDAAQEDNNGCSHDIGESKETESYAAIKNQLKPPEETLSFDDFKKNPVPSDDIDDSGLSIRLIEGTKSMPDLQVEPIVVALPKSGSMKASMADNNSKKRKVDLLRDVIIFKSPDSTEPPISAFLRFVKVNRASVLRKNPQMALLDVQRRLSLMWHFLPEQEKQRYEEAGLEENGHCRMQENTQIELFQPLESQQTLKDLFQEIKPDSSFLRFSKEWLEQLQNGLLSNDEIIDIIEKEWAQLSHLQKRKYWYFEAKTRDKRYWDSKMKTLQIYKRKHNLGSKALKALIGQSVDSNQKSIVPAHSSFENYSSTNTSHMFSAEKSHLENIDGVASNRLIPVASTQCKDNFDDDFIITVKEEFDSDVEHENNVMADHIEAVPMEQSPCAGSQSIEVVQPSSKCSELENGLKIIKRETDVPKVIEGTVKQSFSDEICITGQNSKMELSVLGKTVEPPKCIAPEIDNSAEVAHVPIEETRGDGSVSIGDSIIIDENVYHITMNDHSDITAEDDDIQITDVCFEIEDLSANNVVNLKQQSSHPLLQTKHVDISDNNTDEKACAFSIAAI